MSKLLQQVQRKMKAEKMKQTNILQLFSHFENKIFPSLSSKRPLGLSDMHLRVQRNNYRTSLVCKKIVF